MPKHIVEPPKLEVPRHGLLSTGTVIEETSGEWENGVHFNSNGDWIVNGMCWDCPPSDPSDWQSCSDTLAFKPYYVEFGVEAPFNHAEMQTAEYLEALKVGTGARFEAMIWDGCGAEDTTTPVLTDATALEVSEVSPQYGLASIVEELADADDHVAARGTIHVSSFDAVVLYDYFDDESSDGILRTKVGGHKVVIGNYPRGVIVGHIGDIHIWLGDAEPYEAPERIRETNTLTVQVHRPVLAAWHAGAAYKCPITGPDEP